MRTFYWAWSMILFAAIIVQIGLSGYGAFYAANKLEDEGSTIDEDVFFDGEAKEAVAFALLGYLHLAARPGNVPGATGARGPRVLGQLTPA